MDRPLAPWSIARHLVLRPAILGRDRNFPILLSARDDRPRSRNHLSVQVGPGLFGILGPQMG